MVCLYQDGNIRGHCATFAWPDVWSKCKANQAWPALELLPCNGDNELTHPNTATTIRSQPDCIFPRPIFAHGRSPRFYCHSAAHATCFLTSDHWITKITKASLFPNDIVISKRPPNEQNSRIKHCGSYWLFLIPCMKHKFLVLTWSFQGIMWSLQQPFGKSCSHELWHSHRCVKFCRKPNDLQTIKTGHAKFECKAL